MFKELFKGFRGILCILYLWYPIFFYVIRTLF